MLLLLLFVLLMLDKSFSDHNASTTTDDDAADDDEMAVVVLIGAFVLQTICTVNAVVAGTASAGTCSSILSFVVRGELYLLCGFFGDVRGVLYASLCIVYLGGREWRLVCVATTKEQNTESR